MDWLSFEFGSPLYFALIPFGVIALVVLGVVFVRHKAAQAKKLTEEYLSQHKLAAVVVDGWMPPLRLWIYNRKGDLWCKVRWEDSSEQWVRIRHSLLDGRSVEFLD